MDSTKGSGPLAGIRVIDLSSVVMVPWASQILADLGADVVTVEAPSGNVARSMSAGPREGLSGIALNLLRNKLNVSLDLKDPSDRDKLILLIRNSDLFLTNLRSNVLERAGIDLNELHRHNRRLIICQAIGFSPSSEQSEEPAYDDIIQAASGVCDLHARRSGTPDYVPMAMADKVSALTIAYAVLAAFFHRERTGDGQLLVVPMLDAVLAFNLVEHGGAAVPEPPCGDSGYARVLAPMRRPHRTADGWISVMPYNQDEFVHLFNAGGRPGASDDPRLRTAASRVEYADEIYRELGQVLSQQPTDYWVDVCRVGAVPYSTIASLDDLISELPLAYHPTAGAYHVTPQPVQWSSWPDFRVRRHASTLDEDSEEVFNSLGNDLPQ